MKKFREAIAIHLFCLGNHTGIMDDLTCKQIWDEADKGLQLEYLELIDQLLEIREDGCRLAVVREKGVLPERQFFEDDIGEAGEDGYKLAIRDIKKAHYVQEVKDND